MEYVLPACIGVVALIGCFAVSYLGAAGMVRNGLRAAATVRRRQPGDPTHLAKVVRTTSWPAQWDAWTVGGRYLYLRFRSGVGTVDAYDSPDSETWLESPEGAVAYFEDDDSIEVTLAQFLGYTGLRLAPDAVVIGE